MVDNFALWKARNMGPPMTHPPVCELGMHEWFQRERLLLLEALLVVSL